MRKAIQISTQPIDESDGEYCKWVSICTTALCNDGTMWRNYDGNEWRRLPAIPQPGDVAEI